MEISEAIHSLISNQDPVARRRAAELIVSATIFSNEIIDALVKGLRDKDNGVKDICARSLYFLKDELAEYASTLIAPLMADENIEVRNLSSDILAKLGNIAQEAVLPYLKHEDEQVRMFSCDIIGKIGDEKSLPFLYELLVDPVTNCKISAIDAIGCLRIHSAADNLIKLYQTEEDLKPFIVESLGKISGKKAQEFLMDLVKTEEDQFVQTACIDSLALGGNDISICYYLFEELPNAPRQIQPILLKTIFAIAYRLEQTIQLPLILRHIAQEALFDDDANIRAAGLIALGDYYDISDVPGLIKEVLTFNTESQNLILYNLLKESSTRTVKEFFRELFETADPDGNTVSFITFIPEILDYAKPENVRVALDTILDFMIIRSNTYLLEAINIFLRTDRDFTISKLREMFYSSDYERVEDVMDLILELQLTEFTDDLNSIEFDDDRLTIRAKQILSSISEIWD